MNASILIVTGSFASGKTRLAEYIARAAGPHVLRVDTSMPDRKLECLFDGAPDVLVIDPFEPCAATPYLLSVIAIRRRPTILTSLYQPSTWAAQARKPAARHAIAKIVAEAQRVELAR